MFIGRTDAEAETPVLWPPHVKSWLIGKDSDAGRDWGQEEKGMTEDEMAGWHHWLDGRESEWTPGVGDGQGGLACCNSWGHKESDTTEHLIWSDLIWSRSKSTLSIYPKKNKNTNLKRYLYPHVHCSLEENRQILRIEEWDWKVPQKDLGINTWNRVFLSWQSFTKVQDMGERKSVDRGDSDYIHSVLLCHLVWTYKYVPKPMICFETIWA